MTVKHSSPGETFAAVLPKYLDHLRKKAQKRLRKDKDIERVLGEWSDLIGETALSRISRDLIETEKTKLAKTSSGMPIAEKLVVLRDFFKWAKETKNSIRSNPFDKNRDALLQWADVCLDNFTNINDVELATLKIHIVIEGLLRALLAARLGVSEAKLPPRLTFEVLSDLALAGVEVDSHLVGGIRALNKARNLLAHHLENDDDEVNRLLAIFVRTRADWPATQEEQLRVLSDAVVETGNALTELLFSKS